MLGRDFENIAQVQSFLNYELQGNVHFKSREADNGQVFYDVYINTQFAKHLELMSFSYLNCKFIEPDGSDVDSHCSLESEDIFIGFINELKSHLRKNHKDLLKSASTIIPYYLATVEMESHPDRDSKATKDKFDAAKFTMQALMDLTSGREISKETCETLKLNIAEEDIHDPSVKAYFQDVLRIKLKNLADHMPGTNKASVISGLLIAFGIAISIAGSFLIVPALPVGLALVSLGTMIAGIGGIMTEYKYKFSPIGRLMDHHATLFTSNENLPKKQKRPEPESVKPNA